jgi:bifunctional UDP-N-acetylglucosamine pyrophosphorylase/glucosamine-1-phosphate N-acetyltransferase
MRLGIVILAAGQGTRMKSATPKVLHRLAGRPLLAHVLDTAAALGPVRVVVVYGHGGEQVPAQFAQRHDVVWVEQTPQLGTGHALQQAEPHLDGCDRALVLYGDVPLVEPDTLRALLAHPEGVVLLTVRLPVPTGYGRILRDASGSVRRIVEQKDANEAERAIDEVNTGIMVLDGARLAGWLGRLENANAQGEYYLTDVVGLAVGDGLSVEAVIASDPLEVAGINDRAQLAQLERAFQRRAAERLMRAGVTLADPARFDLRGTLRHGRDVSIDVNVIIEGEVRLGDGVSVGANTVLRDVEAASGVQILENCVIESAFLGPDSRVGPFSRIRPGTRLEGRAHIGNFVEIKKAEVGLGSKVNHLTYVGDATIGRDVNVGAGTITCNYDGANKHRTVIGDRAFIGSNAALVAPVTIGEGATIGAGSTITRDAPAEALTIARARQATLPGWKRPVKTKPGAP